METKQLILTVKELNNLFGLTPPIDLKLPSKELQEMVAVQAAPLLNAKGEDELTEDTAEVLKELIPLYMDQYNKETLRIFKLYELIEDKKVVKETKEEKQPDQEEVKSGKDELVEEVEMADRLADLKDIVKEYDEFKGIRGVLTKYNDVKKLREMMLDFLSKAQGETEDSRNEKVKKEEVDKKEKKTTSKKEDKTTVKKEKKEKVPSAYGTSIEIMCANPEMSMEDLVKKLTKKGINTESGKAAVQTAFAVVRKVVSLLKQNNLMQ